MAIRVVFHLADLHIRNFQFHDQYRKLFNQMISEFKKMCDGYSSEEVRIVIAGDLFHQKISISNEQIIFTSWLLTKLSNIGKVIIIPGNHDFLENNHGRVDSITPVVDLLNDDNITYFRESGVFTDENIEWVVYSLYDHNKRPVFDREVGKFYIGLFHGPIIGCKTTTFEIEDGYDKNIFHGCDIVMCGDIHSRQILQHETTKIFMVGSCIQQNFGENIEGHGFAVYNVEDDTYNSFDLKNDSPYLKFKITDIEDIENEKEQLLNLR
jgi:DNA repair exonuclease SbcCD nuclease subunit